MRRFLLIPLFLGIVLVGVNMGADQPPSTLTVCPQGPPACDFAQIQPAIEAAPAGATIEIAAGVYEEHLYILEKPLTLRGQGENTTIQGVLPGVPVVQIQATQPLQVLLEAMSIVGPDLDPALIQAFGGAEDVVISGSTQAVLRHVQISRALAQGVAIRDTADVVIEDSQVFRNGQGITASGSSRVTIRRVLAFANGIIIGGSAQAQLEEVLVFVNSGAGIVVSGPRAGLAAPTQVLIRDSHVGGNGFGGPAPGISISGGTDVQILRTRIYGNHGHGLSIIDNPHSAVKLELSRSSIFSNRYSGIFATLRNPDTQVELTENEIYANIEYGVEVDTPPCSSIPTSPVRGTISGRKNMIPGPGEGFSNYLGAVCPEELGFLITEQGGSYP